MMPTSLVPTGGASALSPAFDLTPSNNPLASLGANGTTNYDRTIRPCYDIGEYMGSASVGNGAVLTFGTNQRTWTSPPQSPAAGTHAQPDLFSNRFGITTDD